MRVVGRHHQGVFPDMAQEVRQVLVGLERHERASLAEPLLGIAVEVLVDPVPARSLARAPDDGGRLVVASYLVDRVWNPLGSTLDEADPQLWEASQQPGGHDENEAPDDGNRGRAEEGVPTEDLSDRGRAPSQVDAHG